MTEIKQNFATILVPQYDIYGVKNCHRTDDEMQNKHDLQVKRITKKNNLQ